jgi:hypothetical protein
MSSSSKFDNAPLNALESRIDRGIVFEMGDTTTVAFDGGIINYFLLTADKLVIIESQEVISNGNELTVETFINPVVSVRGDRLPVSPMNSYRTEKPESILYRSPTIVSTSSSFPSRYIPGAEGSGNRPIGAHCQRGTSRILEPNGKYIFRVTNNGTLDAATIQMYLMWSEIDLEREKTYF